MEANHHRCLLRVGVLAALVWTGCTKSEPDNRALPSAEPGAAVRRSAAGDRGAAGDRSAASDRSAAAGDSTRRVAPFTAVDVRGAFRVDMQVDPKISGDIDIALSGDDRAIAEVVTRVAGDTLIIETRPGVHGTGVVRLQFAVAQLAEIRSSGSSQVRATGLRGPAVALAVSGSGNIDAEGEMGRMTGKISGSGALLLRGSGDTSEIVIAGSGRVQAKEFRAREVRVRVSGSGDVEVCAAQRLDARISGSGDVVYFCNPEQVSRQISGSGTVRSG